MDSRQLSILKNIGQQSIKLGESIVALVDDIEAKKNAAKPEVPSSPPSDPTPPARVTTPPELDTSSPDAKKLIEGSHGMIKGMSGRSIVFDRDKVKEYFIGQNKQAQEVAVLAGVSIATINKYVRSSGLYHEKYGDDPGAAKSAARRRFFQQGNPAGGMKLTEYQQEHMRYGMKKCPVCGKEFYPAPQHVYKDHSGTLVCSYPCMRLDQKKHGEK